MNRLENNHASYILMHVLDGLKKNLRYQPFRIVKPGNLYSSEFQFNFDFVIHLMDEENLIYRQAINSIDSVLSQIGDELK